MDTGSFLGYRYEGLKSQTHLKETYHTCKEDKRSTHHMLHHRCRMHCPFQGAGVCGATYNLRGKLPDSSETTFSASCKMPFWSSRITSWAKTCVCKERDALHPPASLIQLCKSPGHLHSQASALDHLRSAFSISSWEISLIDIFSSVSPQSWEPMELNENLCCTVWMRKVVVSVLKLMGTAAQATASISSRPAWNVLSEMPKGATAIWVHSGHVLALIMFGLKMSSTGPLWFESVYYITAGP